MKPNNVVEFTPRNRLLEKVCRYIDCVELFLEERDIACNLLLKALKYSDIELKQKVILFLGAFEKEKAARPLYHLLSDPNEHDEIRHVASIQLSVMFPFLKNPQPLVDNLLEDLKSSDSQLRMNAAFALGWEGNLQAVVPLINLLYDPDVQVQESAVNALSNLRDDRIFNLLVDRLENCALDQKRCILFNLWRFFSKQKEAASVYLKYLEDENPELRYDALVLLGGVEEPENYLNSLHGCLHDPDYRLKILALERLFEVETAQLVEFREDMEMLICDPETDVKKTASKLMKRLKRDGASMSCPDFCNNGFGKK